MSKIARPHSIKTILTIAIAVVSISFTLLISAILYSQFSSTIRENATVSTREIVRQVNANLNYYTNDILTIAGYARDLAKQTNELSRSEIERRLSSIVDSRQDIVCLLLFDMEGKVLLSTTDAPLRSQKEMTQQTWFTRAFGGEGNFYFTGPHVAFCADQRLAMRYTAATRHLPNGHCAKKNGQLLDANQDGKAA